MPGIKPSTPTMPAVTPSDLLLPKTWLPIWLPMASSLPTRETTIAAATEISRPGICATSASPTASST